MTQPSAAVLRYLAGQPIAEADILAACRRFATRRFTATRAAKRMAHALSLLRQHQAIRRATRGRAA